VIAVCAATPSSTKHGAASEAGEQTSKEVMHQLSAELLAQNWPRTTSLCSVSGGDEVNPPARHGMKAVQSSTRERRRRRCALLSTPFQALDS